MEDAQLEFGESNKDVEVAPALISVHPSQDSVAVAIGSDLRVFDLRQDCAVVLKDESSKGSHHTGSIRALCYGANGKLLASAGDDKLVKIWSTDSWRCIATVSSEKRVCAVAMSSDGSYVCFADKFGVVWIVDLNEHEGEAKAEKKAAPLLSHYCSIITGLEFSPDGKFIVSADRDFKIRITVFPKKKPVDGAHEIQSFCLGHTEFVSCIAFVSNQENPNGHLVSGSGDSTVRLWDILSGSLLDTCEIGEKAGLLGLNDGEAECNGAVMALSTTPDCSLVAVAVQSLQGIALLNCDISARTLSYSKVVSIGGGTYIPTSIQMCYSTGLLWMITGVSNPGDSKGPCLARVRVISGFNRKTDLDSDTHKLSVLEDTEIPGGTKVVEKLQGSLSCSEEVLSAAAEAVKTALSNLLIKKQYSSEKREFRKRSRNDKKTKP